MSEEFMTATEVTRFHAEGLRLRTEAEVLRKRAAEDRATAEYALGQSEHRRKEIAAIEAGISKREVALKAAGEPAFLAAQKEAADKLAKAEELMARYDRDKHAAAIYLRQCSEREKAA